MPSPSSTLSELTFHRFGVAFGQRVVLAEMELHLAPRGIDVLMGPVKTGKSTLLRTLAGLYQGHALHRTWGLVSLDGAALDDGNRPALVQQQVRLLDQTVLQVLRQAIPSADAVRSPAAWREWAAQFLAEHGQAAWAARLDAPLMDCPLHMQRTLLILSQVAARPRLLMIDEPTAGLSEPDAHTMIQWLRTLGQQCKLLVSLHNQRQARALADAIVLMGGGRVLAYQPVEEFFSRPANELVQQFVQTGSLSLPSPDARPDDLEAGTPLPPPLPPQAVRATATTATAAVLLWQLSLRLQRTRPRLCLHSLRRSSLRRHLRPPWCQLLLRRRSQWPRLWPLRHLSPLSNRHSKLYPLPPQCALWPCRCPCFRVWSWPARWAV